MFIFRRKFTLLSKLFFILIIIVLLSHIFKRSHDTTFEELNIISLANITQLDLSLYINKKTKNVFFIETNYMRNFLSFKEECAIESAAKHNPNSTIYVITVNARPNHNIFPIFYNNIKYLKVNVNRLLYKTVLHDWWFNGKFIKSSFKMAHLSDALRIYLLYQFGGIYFDLDTITIKNLDPIYRYSGIGVFENKKELGNGFLHFNKGNQFLLNVLNEISKNFKPNHWDHNGPRMIQNLLANYCNLTNSTNLMELILDESLFSKKFSDIKSQNKSNNHSCNIFLYPHKLIYPIYWENSSLLFEHNLKFNKTLFENTYSIHFYGWLTSKYDVEAFENSIYEYYAKRNCPLSYDLYIRQFKVS